MATAAPKTIPSAKSVKPAPKPRLTPDIRRVADLLKQVSDPTRLQVLLLLNIKPRNVSELCAEFETQSQPAVSHHLALLRHGRLIEPRRSGKRSLYGLTAAGKDLVDTVINVVS